jgi:recombinational DNA repair protein (RecF pathway)
MLLHVLSVSHGYIVGFLKERSSAFRTTLGTRFLFSLRNQSSSSLPTLIWEGNVWHPAIHTSLSVENLADLQKLLERLTFLLPKGQKHPVLFGALTSVLDTLTCPDIHEKMLLFNLTLLKELGYSPKNLTDNTKRPLSQLKNTSSHPSNNLAPLDFLFFQEKCNERDAEVESLSKEETIAKGRLLIDALFRKLMEA